MGIRYLQNTARFSSESRIEFGENKPKYLNCEPRVGRKFPVLPGKMKKVVCSITT